MVPLVIGERPPSSIRPARRSAPVAGERIVGGLIPCNVIPEEILTDHPKRYRAMIVESGNPAHSIADSQRMREAIESLDFVVVIDVFMTETARLADYVLPATDAVREVRGDVLQLRVPAQRLPPPPALLDPPDGSAARAGDPRPPGRSAGLVTEADTRPVAGGGGAEPRTVRDCVLRAAAAATRARTASPRSSLYRTLGPTLPDGAASAAVLWASPTRCAHVESRRRANAPASAADRRRASGCSTRSSPARRAWFSPTTSGTRLARVSRPHDGTIHLVHPRAARRARPARDDTPPGDDPQWPFLLSAGERRSFTANTIFRDPAWRKKDAEGALRVLPPDAAALGVTDGARRVTTEAGERRRERVS